MGPILGLTGSVGSGKSTVSGFLRDLGAAIIDADLLAREVVETGTPALREIAERFGPDVLADDGTLNRAALGSIVFKDPQALSDLQAIIHPRVRDRELELIKEHRGAPLTVLDVPLLFETGAEALCDRTASVTLDEETRRDRLRRSRGMTDEEIFRRLAHQMPQEEKDRRADFVINNAGSIEETRRAVRDMWNCLVAPDKKTHP